MIAFAVAITVTECRFATHDGYIWPVARRDMRDEAQIRERMAEDIRTLDIPLESLSERHVVALGWTAAQVTAHGGKAMARALFGEKAA